VLFGELDINDGDGILLVFGWKQHVCLDMCVSNLCVGDTITSDVFSIQIHMRPLWGRAISIIYFLPT